MYKNIIKEICDELNIKLSFMSKGWLMKLECDGIYKYILGYKFDLNNFHQLHNSQFLLIVPQNNNLTYELISL